MGAYFTSLVEDLCCNLMTSWVSVKDLQLAKAMPRQSHAFIQDDCSLIQMSGYCRSLDNHQKRDETLSLGRLKIVQMSLPKTRAHVRGRNPPTLSSFVAAAFDHTALKSQLQVYRIAAGTQFRRSH